MKKRLQVFFSIIFLPLLALVAYFFYFLYTPVVNNPKGQVFYLKPGTGLHTLAVQMQTEGLLNYPEFFHIYTWYKATGKNLKSGEYLFPYGATPMTIWSQITTGTGLAYRPFTIIPGWSFIQLRQAINKEATLKHLTTNMNDKALMQLLSSDVTSGEGEFYPETYNYTRDESDLVILKRAFDLMQNRLKEAWNQRTPNLPYQTSYDALIAASLVEKEAYLESERPIIAGVVVNRLRNHMLLQLDPTVVYGMGDKYEGKIHRSDLTTNTPYNTYIHKGLPPTPIAIPSEESLMAAVHPQQNNYYYFVAKGDGSHQFSTHLSEHNTAVEELINHNRFTKDSKLNEHLQDLLELYNGPRQIP